MRQGANKRSRGRNGRNKPHIPLRMQTFDSSGPDVRIRGNAWQVHERYMNMARDAFQAGDRIASENFFQHADHYYRLINLNEDGSPRHPQGQQGHPQGPGGPQPGMEGGPDMGHDGPMNQQGMNQGGDQGPDGGYDQQDRPRDQQDRRMNGRNPNGGEHQGDRGPREHQGREHQGREHQGDRGPREHQGRETQGRENQGRENQGRDNQGRGRGPDRQPRDQGREQLDRHLERHAIDRQAPERHGNDAEMGEEPRRHPAAD